MVAELSGYGTQQEGKTMRLLIDASGVQFRVAGAAKPRPDFKDKEKAGDRSRTASRSGPCAWTRSSPSARPRRPSGSRWLANSPG